MILLVGDYLDRQVLTSRCAQDPLFGHLDTATGPDTAVPTQRDRLPLSSLDTAPGIEANGESKPTGNRTQLAPGKDQIRIEWCLIATSSAATGQPSTRSRRPDPLIRINRLGARA